MRPATVPIRVRYAEIATVRFTGKDTAEGNSWKAWIERKEREKAQPAPLPARRRVSDLLILTAVELEAAGLARELELPAETGRPSDSSPGASSYRFSSYRTYGRPGLRIAPVGLGAPSSPSAGPPAGTDSTRRS